MVHIFRFHGLAPAHFVLSCAELEDAEIASDAMDHNYPTCKHMIVPDSWVTKREDNEDE